MAQVHSMMARCVVVILYRLHMGRLCRSEEARQIGAPPDGGAGRNLAHWGRRPHKDRRRGQPAQRLR
jgi:hypothetical protein